MGLFEETKAKAFAPMGFKNQRRNLRVLKQVGTSNKSVDESRKALIPGKRVSKNGKIYWETRRSRSDQKGSTV
jgi:hypothetical protein